MVKSADEPHSRSLKVEGVPNKRQYLESLKIIDGEGPSITMTHMGDYLEIDGPINVDALVIGSGNDAGNFSAVFG